MNIEVYDPSQELKSIVKNYVVFNSIDEIHKMIFLPNGGNFIIFNRGADINVKLYTEDSLYKVPDGYSVGLKTNRVQYVFDAKYKNDNNSFPMIVVELLPIGFYKLFNEDLTSLEYQYRNIEKDIVDRYFSKVYSNGTIDDEIEYLNSSIKALESSHNHSRLPVEDVIDRIYNDYQLNISVEDLLKEFKYSRSTLERHFKKVLGLTPKQFIFIIKFCRTLLSYIDKNRTLRDIKYIYSDNSHMNVVFKKFLGISPSEIFTKVLDGENDIYQLSVLKIQRESF